MRNFTWTLFSFVCLALLPVTAGCAAETGSGNPFAGVLQAKGIVRASPQAAAVDPDGEPLDNSFSHDGAFGEFLDRYKGDCGPYAGSNFLRLNGRQVTAQQIYDETNYRVGPGLAPHDLAAAIGRNAPGLNVRVGSLNGRVARADATRQLGKYLIPDSVRFLLDRQSAGRGTLSVITLLTTGNRLHWVTVSNVVVLTKAKAEAMNLDLEPPDPFRPFGVGDARGGVTYRPLFFVVTLQKDMIPTFVRADAFDTRWGSSMASPTLRAVLKMKSIHPYTYIMEETPQPAGPAATAAATAAAKSAGAKVVAAAQNAAPKGVQAGTRPNPPLASPQSAAPRFVAP